jgi:hydrogenase maturation factor
VNLCFGEIITTYSENGLRFGRVRVGGAIKAVSLDFVKDAAIGERVLVCDGVALNRVDETIQPAIFEQP